MERGGSIQKIGTRSGLTALYAGAYARAMTNNGTATTAQTAIVRDEITGKTYIGTRNGDRWTFPALRGTWWADDTMHEGEQIFTEMDGEVCSFIVTSRLNA